MLTHWVVFLLCVVPSKLHSGGSGSGCMYSDLVSDRAVVVVETGSMPSMEKFIGGRLDPASASDGETVLVECQPKHAGGGRATCTNGGWSNKPTCTKGKGKDGWKWKDARDICTVYDKDYLYGVCGRVSGTNVSGACSSKDMTKGKSCWKQAFTKKKKATEYANMCLCATPGKV